MKDPGTHIYELNNYIELDLTPQESQLRVLQQYTEQQLRFLIDQSLTGSLKASAILSLSRTCHKTRP